MTAGLALTANGSSSSPILRRQEPRATEAAGAVPDVPKPLTSGARADGRFGKQDVVYLPDEDAYRCLAGQRLVSERPLAV